MKTGQNILNKNISEVYSISFLGLEALLRRLAFKDSVLFKNHNPDIIMDEYLFASGIYFNLFSEYGVGKKLEPLMIELLKKGKINPEKFKDNIFFQEIVNLSGDIAPLIRDIGNGREADWTYNYAIYTLNKSDKISIERLERLYPLLNDGETNDMSKETNDEGSSEEILEELSETNGKSSEMSETNLTNNEEIQIRFCDCNFCKEFRKYNCPKDKHINEVIMEVLKSYM